MEIFRALEFDKTYSKEQIMEWYLNYIYLGDNCYGVATAAQNYFGKELDELSLAECASLISITNNPSKYGPNSNLRGYRPGHRCGKDRPGTSTRSGRNWCSGKCGIWA